MSWLRRLTPERSERLIDEQCAPVFRPLAEAVLFELRHLVEDRHGADVVVRVVEVARSPQRQLRRLDEGASRAGPGQSAHCVRFASGDPASFAVDFWVLDPTSGRPMPDGHAAWSCVPGAAALVDARRLESGAGYRSIRGGDWPHVEFRPWRSLTIDRGRRHPRVLR